MLYKNQNIFSGTKKSSKKFKYFKDLNCKPHNCDCNCDDNDVDDDDGDLAVLEMAEILFMVWWC